MAPRFPAALISVDTYKPGVATECLALGASIVNDITGLEDPAMVEAVAGAGAGVVIMHMRGRPKTMQRDVRYDDVVGEVRTFLRDSALTWLEEFRCDGLRFDAIDQIKDTHHEEILAERARAVR